MTQPSASSVTLPPPRGGYPAASIQVPHSYHQGPAGRPHGHKMAQTCPALAVYPWSSLQSFCFSERGIDGL